MKESNLKERASTSERRSKQCGFAVVAGLVIEVCLAVIYREHNTWIENWAPVIGDILVALGVYGEIHFAGVVKSAEDELRQLSEQKLAAAIERAATAERQTEKLRAVTDWRRLSQAEHETLALTLQASGTGASVVFSVVMNDQESLHFAQLISIPFKAAGWKVGYSFESFTHEIMSGILLPDPSGNAFEEIRNVNIRVRDAFISANIGFVTGWPSAYMRTPGGEPLVAPIASVYIGPKPMPMLE